MIRYGFHPRQEVWDAAEYAVDVSLEANPERAGDVDRDVAILAVQLAMATSGCILNAFRGEFSGCSRVAASAEEDFDEWARPLRELWEQDPARVYPAVLVSTVAATRIIAHVTVGDTRLRQETTTGFALSVYVTMFFELVMAREDRARDYMDVVATVSDHFLDTYYQMTDSRQPEVVSETDGLYVSVRVHILRLLESYFTHLFTAGYDYGSVSANVAIILDLVPHIDVTLGEEAELEFSIRQVSDVAYLLLLFSHRRTDVRDVTQPLLSDEGGAGNGALH